MKTIKKILCGIMFVAVCFCLMACNNIQEKTLKSVVVEVAMPKNLTIKESVAACQSVKAVKGLVLTGFDKLSNEDVEMVILEMSDGIWGNEISVEINQNLVKIYFTQSGDFELEQHIVQLPLV